MIGDVARAQAQLPSDLADPDRTHTAFVERSPRQLEDTVCRARLSIVSKALVKALVMRGHQRTNTAVFVPDRIDFAQLYDLLCEVMLQDLENAWLLRDYVGVMLALPSLRAFHDRLQRARESRVDALVSRLVAARLLERRRAERALPQLRIQLLTQVMFWLPSALCTAPDRDPALALNAHVRAALALFIPLCTVTGRRGLEAVLRDR